MSKTSRKLFRVKSNTLQENLSRTNVKNEEEVLLLNAPKETDEIFRKLSIPTKKDFVNDQLKDYREINEFEKTFKGLEAFKGSYIKEICNKYFLQLMSVDNLRGYLHEDAAATIKEFIVKYDKVISYSNFYILAPREAFTEKGYGKQVETFIIFFRECNDTSSSSYNKAREEHIFTQIHSSGSDFSSLRLWKKFIDPTVYNSEKFARFTINSLISIQLIISIISALLGGIGFSIFLLICWVISIVLYSKFNTFDSDKYWNKIYRD